MTTNEICRLLGLTRREIQWWEETGAVQCDWADHFRWFTEDQALAVAIVSELRRKGVTLARIRKMKLRKALGEFLVVWKSAGRWCARDGLIQTVAHAPGPCVVVSVEDLRAKLWPAQKTFESRQSAAATLTQ